jgi:hypothetical protein
MGAAAKIRKQRATSAAQLLKILPIAFGIAFTARGFSD